MNRNIRPLVLELLELKQKLAPLERQFETAKETIRAAGANTHVEPGVGKVIVSAPVERKPKGTEIVIDPERLETADPALKARLFALGVLRIETIYTRASRAKVEVSLEAA